MRGVMTSITEKDYPKLMTLEDAIEEYAAKTREEEFNELKAL